MKKSFSFAVITALIAVLGVTMAGEVASNAFAPTAVEAVVQTSAPTPAPVDFWSVHTLFFVFFMFILPRTTMLVTGICFYPFAHPILFFFGWLLAPRLTVAIIATSVYWDTNPVLVTFAWINAFCVGSASTGATAKQASR